MKEIENKLKEILIQGEETLLRVFGLKYSIATIFMSFFSFSFQNVPR